MLSLFGPPCRWIQVHVYVLRISDCNEQCSSCSSSSSSSCCCLTQWSSNSLRYSQNDESSSRSIPMRAIPEPRKLPRCADTACQVCYWSLIEFTCAGRTTVKSSVSTTQPEVNRVTVYMYCTGYTHATVDTIWKSVSPNSSTCNKKVQASELFRLMRRQHTDLLLKIYLITDLGNKNKREIKN